MLIIVLCFVVLEFGHSAYINQLSLPVPTYSNPNPFLYFQCRRTGKTGKTKALSSLEKPRFWYDPSDNRGSKLRYTIALKSSRSESMESTLKDIVSHIQDILTARAVDESLSQKQLWIALAGAPGSGKSTLSKELARVLDSHGIATTVIPMDGFHLYRRELDQMPNAAEAHAKRGSHWTFNATRLVQVHMRCII